MMTNIHALIEIILALTNLMFKLKDINKNAFFLLVNLDSTLVVSVRIRGLDCIQDNILAVCESCVVRDSRAKCRPDNSRG